MRRKHSILPAMPANPCPFDAELERLERLQADGWLTPTQYKEDRAAVIAKMNAGARL